MSTIYKFIIICFPILFLMCLGNIEAQNLAVNDNTQLTTSEKKDTSADASFRHAMRTIPESSKVDIARDSVPDPRAFSNQGWYRSQVGIANTSSGLIATYRKSDFHTANYTDIMTAYSSDGGRSWSGHHRIAHADIWNEGGAWVAPQLSKLSDGRLVLISDFGQRNQGQNWPMLSEWQKPHRGMSNHLFWSADNGKTWSGPHQIDQIGGEPGYIEELSDGTLLYTRTISKEAESLWNPPQPWGKVYYTNEVVASTDGGNTWKLRSVLSDNKYHGDVEVGLVEISPGKVMAISRIGFGNGQFGQPSRIFISNNGGKTWEPPQLSPFYGQRVIAHRLQSGNIVLTYRNKWGTPGNYAAVIDPAEELPYEPASYIFDSSRCRLEDGIMTIDTDEGIRNIVTYSFYPAQNPESKVEIEAELKVEEADINGVNISAGVWIRFESDQVSLADRPEESFTIDATNWHRYLIVRENKTVSIFVDGDLKLKASTDGLETRVVRIGNRQVKGPNFFHQIGEVEPTGWGTKSLSHWRALAVKVENKEDYNIDWTWNPETGYPDQFRRDRIVLLDRIAASHGHTGYGDVTQLEDGSIIIADYTVGGNGGKPAPTSFVRAYLTSEKELTATNK